MAKSRLTAPVMLPPWPRNLGPATAPGLQSGAATIDEAGDRVIIIGHVLWEDGASHDLRTIHWRTSSASSPVLTLRVGPRDVDLTAGPPARDDGTVDEFGTHVNPAANTGFSTTLSADRAVAHGALLAIVWDCSAYTSGNVQVSTHTAGTPTSPGRPVLTLFDDPTFTTFGANSIPHFTLEAADGTFGLIHGCLPRLSAAVNAEAFNVDTASGGDERGVSFTVDAPVWLSTAAFLMQAAAGAAYSVEVYEDGVAMSGGSVSIDPNTWNADATVRWHEVVFPDLALTPGHAYDVMIKPSTTANVTLYSFDVSAAGHLRPFAGTLHYSERTGGGTINRTTTRLPYVALGLIAVDDGAGGSGGLILHPGMTGGLNA